MIFFFFLFALSMFLAPGIAAPPHVSVEALLQAGRTDDALREAESLLASDRGHLVPPVASCSLASHLQSSTNTTMIERSLPLYEHCVTRGAGSIPAYFPVYYSFALLQVGRLEKADAVLRSVKSEVLRRTLDASQVARAVRGIVATAGIQPGVDFDLLREALELVPWEDGRSWSCFGGREEVSQALQKNRTDVCGRDPPEMTREAAGRIIEAMIPDGTRTGTGLLSAGAPLGVKFRILTLPVSQDHHVSKGIHEHGVWDIRLSEFILRGLGPANPSAKSSKNKSRRLFLDIGANIGFYSLLAVAHGHRAIAVEPVSTNLAYINASIRFNPGFEKRLSVRRAALSDEASSEPVCVVSEGGKETNKWNGQVDLKGASRTDCLDRCPLSLPIQVVSLEEWKDVRVLKIDVEGFETRIVRGLKQHFAVHKPCLIIFEFHEAMTRLAGTPNTLELFDFFEAQGYEYIFFHPFDYIMRKAKAGPECK
jgi:FkbM family methyltransferase